MKQKKHCKSKNTSHKNQALDTGRGVIKDNFLAAIVTSPVYKMQVVKAKKGKGSYNRTQKHKDSVSYLMAA